MRTVAAPRLVAQPPRLGGECCVPSGAPLAQPFQPRGRAMPARLQQPGGGTAPSMRLRGDMRARAAPLRTVRGVVEQAELVDDADGMGWEEYALREDEDGNPLDEMRRPMPAEMRCFDRAKIYVKAGDGGNGLTAFRREAQMAMGGPAGGNGGARPSLVPACCSPFAAAS